MVDPAPRCAVFDLDGTLVETAPDLIGALNMLLDEIGLPRVAPAAARITAGMGGRMLIEYGHRAAGAALTEARFAELLPRFLAHYEARIDLESRLYAGAAPALDGLADAGWRLAICTNKPERLARLLLGRLGVLDRFGALIGADTLPVRKPDPKPVWAAIDGAGGARARSVMIGDTVTDRDAGRNAGVPVALVDYGYSLTPVATLTPDAVVSGFGELPLALEQLAAAS